MKQNKEVRIIGVTGGIGAGKSEILSYIKKHYNCRIYLADEVAHKVKEVGQEAYEPLVELLGRDVLDADGSINRERMAQKIFADNQVLFQVNEIVHPAVRRFVEQAIADAKEKKDVEKDKNRIKGDIEKFMRAMTPQMRSQITQKPETQ